jgi:hypothetical protein
MSQGKGNQPAFMQELRVAQSSPQGVPESILEMARRFEKARAASQGANAHERARLLKVLDRMDAIILGFIRNLDGQRREAEGLDELEILKLKALKLKALRLQEKKSAGNN